MKFFHRHKTYLELFCIDIENGDKKLLKSIIKKLNMIKNNDDYNDENHEEKENINQKPCFLLIYNCKWSDLLDINIYSIINSNSSYIIIYDEEKYSYN